MPLLGFSFMPLEKPEVCFAEVCFVFLLCHLLLNDFFVFRLFGGRRQAEMGKEWEKRLGGQSGLEGRGKALFWRGGSAWGIFWFGGVLAVPKAL